MRILLFAILGLTACSQKNNPGSDNWETPTLTIKRDSDTTANRTALTSSFARDLKSSDTFSFEFKGDSNSKQKTISNLHVNANCAEDAELTKEKFEDAFDLGPTAVFQALDLLPPTAIFESATQIFCSWTLTISNFSGSTRTYSLKPMKLTVVETEAKIKLFENQIAIKPGSLIDIDDADKVIFSSLDVGNFTTKLVCDLVTISGSNISRLSDLIVLNSSDDTKRRAHPIQRCLIEIKSGSGRISRSAGFQVYLFPSRLATTEVDYSTYFEQDAGSRGSLEIGTAILRNESDEPRTFDVNYKSFSLDVLFFDDFQDGRTMYPDTFDFFPTANGSLSINLPPNSQTVVVNGRTLPVVPPHSVVSVQLLLSLNLDSRCASGGRYSRAGYKINEVKEMITEHAGYSIIRASG